MAVCCPNISISMPCSHYLSAFFHGQGIKEGSVGCLRFLECFSWDIFVAEYQVAHVQR